MGCIVCLLDGAAAFRRRRRAASRGLHRARGTRARDVEAHDRLTASRTRIVEAGISERRRLERNLHDGAQQRLVSLSLQLGLVKRALRGDADRAEELLGQPPVRSSTVRWRSSASCPWAPPGRADRPRARGRSEFARGPRALSRRRCRRAKRAVGRCARGGRLLRGGGVLDERSRRRRGVGWPRRHVDRRSGCRCGGSRQWPRRCDPGRGIGIARLGRPCRGARGSARRQEPDRRRHRCARTASPAVTSLASSTSSGRAVDSAERDERLVHAFAPLLAEPARVRPRAAGTPLRAKTPSVSDGERLAEPAVAGSPRRRRRRARTARSARRTRRSGSRGGSAPSSPGCSSRRPAGRRGRRRCGAALPGQADRSRRPP